MTGGDATAGSDPVAVRRAGLARRVALAKRFGWACLLAAMLAFGAGVATEFEPWTVTATVVAIVTAIIVLPVPIVLGYGIRAAEREDRARDALHRPSRRSEPRG